MTAPPPPEESNVDSTHLSLKNARDVPLIKVKLENVTYAPIAASVGKSGGKTENKRTVVLDKISTEIEPYQLTGWMGPSGSGKTSLISVVADLIPHSALSPDGIITVNGELGKIPKRLVGVVWQDDLLLSNLTVEENVFFAARLKTPEITPDPEVHDLVQETLKELGLQHVSNTLVGSPFGPRRGVSGGERKRVSVAVELVVRPSVLLLDEPTSGLDATTSQSLVLTLRDLATLGHTVAVVIHQPRTEIYNMLDRLLLLSKGHVVYDGHPGQARAHLEACPDLEQLPPETGIADWMMDVVIDDERRKEDVGGPRLAEHWKLHGKEVPSAAPAAAVADDVDEIVTKSHAHQQHMSSLKELQSGPKFNVSFLTQLKHLAYRTSKQQRGERITMTALYLQVAYVCATSLFWWRLPNDTSAVFEHNSLLFFMLIAQSIGIVTSAVTVFQQERALLRRERAKKMYGVASYFLAKTASDMSNNVVLPVLYGMVVYWTAGFRPEFVAYLKFILAYYLTLSTAQSMGLWLSVAITRPVMALVLAPPLTLFFIVLGGFYVPFKSMPPGVRWLTWISFARYGYSALVINQWQGYSVPCAADASIQVGTSGACPLPGDDVIASLGITGVTKNYWFNVGLVALLQVVFRLAAYRKLRATK